MNDLLLTYYGDDFTGSTDVMEALSVNGVATVLFLQLPSDHQLRRFPDCHAVGVAGTSRSQSPEWMSEYLPPVFERLREMSAPLCHYKVCSTFDSSPQVGSIGRAIEIGRRCFGSSWTPLVVGAPVLRRYTVFGNLFATAGSETHRIDRHPTMSRHPVTPMNEGDLRRHLSRQTSLKIGLVDILALRSADPAARLEAVLADNPGVVLFDILDEASLAQTGRLIWRHPNRPRFAAGSSGLEYALVAWWRAGGDVAVSMPSFRATASDRVVVVSGSCSPVTERQIRWAESAGYRGIPLDAAALANGTSDALESARLGALQALSEGRSVVLYTALGPDSPMMVDADTRADAGFRSRLGLRLGLLLRDLLRSSGTRRAVVCGGDTSGSAAQELGVYALRMIRPMAPGSPLCRAYSEDKELDGLEVVLKGGQVGDETLFEMVRNGAN